MNTAASAPSVAVATGAVQNVGLPTVQNASSGPSVRRRNSRVATAKEVSCAVSRIAIALTLRTLTSKLQPASTDSSPMPAPSWSRKRIEMCASSQRRVPRPITNAPKSGRAAATAYFDSSRTGYPTTPRSGVTRRPCRGPAGVIERGAAGVPSPANCACVASLRD